MPVGTASKAMLLLSGGIDSPVAGYMISKRGVTLSATYFHAPPYTSEQAKQKVVDLAKLVAKYSGPIDLHIVNFTDIQLYIYQQCAHEELTIIMRRYMMRLAEYFAKKNDCIGLVTGESIGQVASQTAEALVVTDACVQMPVMRPLIAMDKVDIMDKAQETVTGQVRAKLYKGGVWPLCRTSPYSLFNKNLATFEASNYDHHDAAGFIKLNSLRLVQYANVKKHLQESK